MNRFALVVLTLVIACSFTSWPADAATARENKRLREGKITKNEAQHLVLKKFPGATIRNCQLTRGKGHSVWVLDLLKPGAAGPTKVQVDGLSGKISL